MFIKLMIHSFSSPRKRRFVLLPQYKIVSLYDIYTRLTLTLQKKKHLERSFEEYLFEKHCIRSLTVVVLVENDGDGDDDWMNSNRTNDWIRSFHRLPYLHEE